MIVCPRCSKENQDHYKFCLGCGAELPRDAAHAPKQFTAPTPPSGFAAGGAPPAAPLPKAAPAAASGSPVFGGAAAASGPMARSGGGGGGGAFGMSAGGGGAAAGAVAAAAAVESQPGPSLAGMAQAVAAGGTTTPCPKCGTNVPHGYKFCGTCGHPMQHAAPASAPIAPSAAAMGSARGSLVLIRPDGTEGDSFPLGEASTSVGREAGGLFANDSYLSPRHATFTFKGGQLFVKDEGSLNGIYIRIDRDVPTELEDGSIFRIGQEIVRFERIPAPQPGRDGVEAMGSPNPGFIGRICLVIGRDTTGNAYPVPPEGMHLGRERGDIIFPEDGYVSGLHCRIHEENGRVMLTDVGSSNGTFVRAEAEHQLRSGDLLLMGQQLFRAQY